MDRGRRCRRVQAETSPDPPGRPVRCDGLRHRRPVDDHAGRRSAAPDRSPATTTTGIREPSWIMVDKITTVRRTSVQTRVGRLPAALMVEVERSVLTFLGVAD
nr:type II toxin-antitoxin system PemK/MazF family toxin [Mumia flava]